MLTIHRTHLHRGSSRHRAVDARRIRSPPLAVLACQAQARKRQTVGDRVFGGSEQQNTAKPSPQYSHRAKHPLAIVLVVHIANKALKALPPSHHARAQCARGGLAAFVTRGRFEPVGHDNPDNRASTAPSRRGRLFIFSVNFSFL